MKLEDLDNALNASWCVETAYHEDRKYWSEDKKSTGQCTVTAMIVYDYFGGKIVRGFSEKYNLFHYWNEIDGKKVDLTFDQFFDKKNDINFTKIVYKTKNDLMNISSVKERYLLLKSKVDKYIKKI